MDIKKYMQNLDKKNMLIAFIIVVFIIIGMTFYTNGNNSEISVPVINVTEITNENGYEDNAETIQYENGVYRYKFGHIGVLKGYIFSNEVIFQREDNETFILLRITPDMDPKDDIPEAYIVPNIENDIMEINIFLDQDFKNMLGNRTNIIWGSTYQNFKKYDFSTEYKKGIYVDTVYDNDTERFRIGGNDANIFVGDATLEDADTQNMEGVTGVFLK